MEDAAPRPADAQRVALEVVPLDVPADGNVIVGQAHFIKTVDDVHQALAASVPGLRFGVAFCEASGARLVRCSGSDDELLDCARRNALAIGAGHAFVVVLADGYPINVLTALKLVPEVCRIICATANPVEVLVAVTALGRGIAGVVDGRTPLGIEGSDDIAERRELVRRLGYAP
ncbi:MAG TPA: adenosine-specific kinase [Baekduia sp.]|nr:adenosine-specific kinase [Baekduia sp.]